MILQIWQLESEIMKDWELVDVAFSQTKTPGEILLESLASISTSLFNLDESDSLLYNMEESISLLTTYFNKLKILITFSSLFSESYFSLNSPACGHSQAPSLGILQEYVYFPL